MADRHGGDWKGLEDAIRRAYFEGERFADTDEYNKGKLANNAKLGMIAYGIIERDGSLTNFGTLLHSLRDQENRLYEELARHILLNRHGLTLVQCIQDMQVAGETPDLGKLRAWLEERGVHFPRGGKHPSIMRLWLERAGVFVDGWRIDDARLEQLLGLGSEEVEVLARLTREQRAYLKTLANLGGPGPFASNDIERLAAATYGVRFNEKALHARVVVPLAQAGFLSYAKTTRSKPTEITPTEKLEREIVVPVLDQLEQQVGSDIRTLLRKPLESILGNLDSADKHVRGLALEALAFKLMRLIDLTYVATRLRGTETGGAEVDVVFESSRLVFSRWQVQCKNAARVTLDDVAKEVGLTYFLKSNVIVIVSSGRVDAQAREYAASVVGSTGLRIVFIDGDVLQMIAHTPGTFVDVLSDANCRASGGSPLLLWDETHPLLLSQRVSAA